MFTVDALRALYSRKKKSFRVVENRFLQCVESIFVNLPQFAKSGLIESLNGFFWYFSLHPLGYFGLVSSFLFLWVFVSQQYFRLRRHRNVRLEDRVDGGRRSTFISVNPFFKSLERWERSCWLQILQTACLPSSFYIECWCSIVNKGPVEISWKQNKRVNLTWTMLYLI